MSHEKQHYSQAGERLLSIREAALVLGISLPTFWRRVADGTIPPPVKVGARSLCPYSDILGVIEAAKQRRAQETGGRDD